MSDDTIGDESQEETILRRLLSRWTMTPPLLLVVTTRNQGEVQVVLRMSNDHVEIIDMVVISDDENHPMARRR